MPPLRTLGLLIALSSAPLWAQVEASTNGQEEKSSPETTSPSAGQKEEATLPTSKTSGNSLELEVTKSKKPDYPLQAASEGIQGQVWVKFIVSETGDVESIEVISGDPILADAAVHALKKWKFKPFIKNGKAVKVSTKMPFDFYFAGKAMEKGQSSDRTATSDLPPTTKTASSNASPSPFSVTDKSSSLDAADAPKRVRVSSGVTQGMLIHQIAPVYPESARRNRVEGTVLLQAVIGKDGHILNLQPISGPKELIPAAVGAVQQWRYKPYLLLGQPVEVQTVITVNFRLNR